MSRIDLPQCERCGRCSGGCAPLALELGGIRILDADGNHLRDMVLCHRCQRHAIVMTGRGAKQIAARVRRLAAGDVKALRAAAAGGE